MDPSFVDLYCERTQPGLWAEPLNAVTNTAFLLAAWDLRRRCASRLRPAGPDLLALPVLVAGIGVASALFHTLSTRWAGALDSAFIAAYLLVYVVVFARRVGGAPWRRAWMAAPAFAIFSVAIVAGWAAVPGTQLRGVGLYAAAWLGLGGLAAWAALKRRTPASSLLGSATVLFALSLALRQADLPLCSMWPLGTHFAWHLLNALVLWLSARAVLQSAAECPGTDA